MPGRGSPGSPGFGLNSQSNGDKNNTSEKIKTSEADSDNVKKKNPTNNEKRQFFVNHFQIVERNLVFTTAYNGMR